MRRVLTLLVIAVLLGGQAGVPALRPGEVVVEASEPGVIRGEAWDPVADRTAAGVMISLFRPGRDSDRVYPEPWVQEPGEVDEAVARVRADHDGRFFFRGLEPGYYVVRCRGVLHGDSGELHLTREQPEAELSLRVEVGATITGLVLDPKAQPLTDYTVHVVGLDLGDGLNVAHDHQANLHVQTDPQGRYTLHPLPTGTVWIQAASYAFGFSAPTAHEVRSGQRIDGVDIVVPDERGSLGRRSENAAGIGVRLIFGPEGPRIGHLIEGMPAEAAGLREGDLIVELEGRPTRFMPSTEFLGRCLGAVGGEVSLTYLRSDGTSGEVTLVRRAFPG